MMTFIGVVAVSLGCLIFLGVVGIMADLAERKIHARRREEIDKEWHPFWHGDPPDGDTFP